MWLRRASQLARPRLGEGQGKAKKLSERTRKRAAEADDSNEDGAEQEEEEEEVADGDVDVDPEGVRLRSDVDVATLPEPDADNIRCERCIKKLFVNLLSGGVDFLDCVAQLTATGNVCEVREAARKSCFDRVPDVNGLRKYNRWMDIAIDLCLANRTRDVASTDPVYGVAESELVMIRWYFAANNINTQPAGGLRRSAKFSKDVTMADIHRAATQGATLNAVAVTDAVGTQLRELGDHQVAAIEAMGDRIVAALRSTMTSRAAVTLRTDETEVEIGSTKAGHRRDSAAPGGLEKGSVDGAVE